MGEGHSLRTSEYFSLGHICLPDLQQTGHISGGYRELPLIASAVLNISRLGVYRTIGPWQVVKLIVQTSQKRILWHTVSFMTARHI